MLKQLMSSREAQHDQKVMRTLMEEELRVCLAVANVYPKNYHAWSHRCQVSLLLDKEQVSKPCKDPPQQ